MININIFGGPGVGKSTLAPKIFTKMKVRGYKVEYIQEYAKDLTFGKDFTKLSDQLHILGEQYHRMYRLRDQIDFLIHDSPFLLGIAYLSDDPHLNKDDYTKLVVGIFNSYKSINIFLERNTEEFGYQEYGRSQSLSEAELVDEKIKNILDTHNIEYHTIKAGKKAHKEILKLIYN